MTLSQVLIDENKKLTDENNQLKAEIKSYENKVTKVKDILKSKLELAKDMGLVVTIEVVNDCIDIIDEVFK